MPKPVLGRDLGSLLGRAPGEKGDSKIDPKPPARTSAGAGVRSLIRGTRPEPPVPSAPYEAAIEEAAPLPIWYLFAGDVLLVALALLTVWLSPHPLSGPRIAFCMGTIGLAAALGVIAAVQSRARARVTPQGKSPKQFGNDQASRRHPN